MRYIRAGALTRSESWWQLARYMGHWQLRGYGLFAVIERESERLIGHLGFVDPEGGLGFELGWALARDAWGKGYALEGTRAALHHAFTALNRDHVLCVIRPENVRSVQLALKLGATPEKSSDAHEPATLTYRITRPDGLG